MFSKTSGGYTAAQSILEAVRAAGIAVRSTPIVEAPSLYVLKGTVAPAVLIEHGFHTNEGDVKNLRNSSYRQRLAEAEARGILDYLGIAWRKRTHRERQSRRRLKKRWSGSPVRESCWATAPET